MVFPNESDTGARMELANRVFFRMYQCANMLHKTGTKAVESEGLTTQQWAVLGALSAHERATIEQFLQQVITVYQTTLPGTSGKKNP